MLFDFLILDDVHVADEAEDDESVVQGKIVETEVRGNFYMSPVHHRFEVG